MLATLADRAGAQLGCLADGIAGRRCGVRRPPAAHAAAERPRNRVALVGRQRRPGQPGRRPAGGCAAPAGGHAALRAAGQLHAEAAATASISEVVHEPPRAQARCLASHHRAIAPKATGLHLVALPDAQVSLRNCSSRATPVWTGCGCSLANLAWVASMAPDSQTRRRCLSRTPSHKARPSSSRPRTLRPRATAASHPATQVHAEHPGPLRELRPPDISPV